MEKYERYWINLRGCPIGTPFDLWRKNYFLKFGEPPADTAKMYPSLSWQTITSIARATVHDGTDQDAVLALFEGQGPDVELAVAQEYFAEWRKHAPFMPDAFQDVSARHARTSPEPLDEFLEDWRKALPKRTTVHPPLPLITIATGSVGAVTFDEACGLVFEYGSSRGRGHYFVLPEGHDLGQYRLVRDDLEEWVVDPFARPITRSGIEELLVDKNSGDISQPPLDFPGTEAEAWWNDAVDAPAARASDNLPCLARVELPIVVSTPVPRCAIRTRCSPPVRRTHARLRAWWEPRGRTCNGVGNAR